MTVRAVRHYHQKGLLAEPERDASGYRRYSAEDAIALVKIKILADAGVPLTRIKALSGADPAEFDAAIADIDRSLQERIDELHEARRRIATLVGGERLFVPGDVADYLDRLRALGVSSRSLDLERDEWMLLRVTAPDLVSTWIAEKSASLDDEEFQALYLETDRAFDWAPNDLRLPPLARRMADWAAAHGDEPSDQARATPGPVLAKLLDDHFRRVSPAWDRLSGLAQAAHQERGAQ